MRTKVIAVGIAIVLAGAAWWIRPRGAGDPVTSPGASVVSSDQPPQADRIGEPVLAASNTLTQLFAGTPDAATLSNDERKTRMRGLFDAVRAVSREVPRDTFDMNAALDQAGRDPAKLHAWVRTHTVWLPYRGALRGAPGTLMDRAGNSLDRSLLLARLLRAAGISARLARAPLTGDQAARLQQSLQTPVAAAAPDAVAAEAAGTVIDTYAKQAGRDPAPIREQLQQTEEISRRAAEDVKRRVATQTARLVKDLGLESAATDTSAADLAALRDHWWVQAQAGSTWTDLDPALADPGRSVVPAQDTLDPDALPPDLHHTVEVRVIVEQWDGTAFQERRPVSIDLRPSEVVGETLRLQHLPMAWPADPIAPSAPDAQRRWTETALAQQEWLPVFMLGAKRVSQSSVMATGDLNPRPGTKKRGPVGGYVDLFGGGSDPAAAPAAPGVLTAEWIEYEIRSPGRAPRIVRREVFDLVGGAVRTARQAPSALTDELKLTRALSLLSETEILLQANQPSAAFLTHLMGSRLLENEPLLTSLVTAAPPADARSMLDQLRGAKPLPGALHALAAARAEWRRAPGTVQLHQPNVLSQHTFPRQDAAGQIGVVAAIDIVANEVVPSGGTPGERFVARVEQGVLDANAEAALIGAAANGGTTADAYGVDDAAARWVPVRSVGDLEPLSVSPELRARFEAELRNGFVLLVPPAAPNAPATWWRVDPKTGDTLSFGDRGWGQASEEYLFVTGIVAVATLLCTGVFVGLFNSRVGGTALMCLGVVLVSVGGPGMFGGGALVAGLSRLLVALGTAAANLGFWNMTSLR